MNIVKDRYHLFCIVWWCLLALKYLFLTKNIQTTFNKAAMKEAVLNSRTLSLKIVQGKVRLRKWKVNPTIFLMDNITEFIHVNYILKQIIIYQPKIQKFSVFWTVLIWSKNIELMQTNSIFNSNIIPRIVICYVFKLVP